MMTENTDLSPTTELGNSAMDGSNETGTSRTADSDPLSTNNTQFNPSQTPSSKNWISFDGNSSDKSSESPVKTASSPSRASGLLPPPPSKERSHGSLKTGEPGADVAQIEVSVESASLSAPKSVQQPAPLSENTANGSGTKPGKDGGKGNTATVKPTSTSPPGTTQHTLANGKKIATIMPQNQYCPWVLPAKFDAYKMPKSLISNSLTLPVEDFVTVMRMLTNDIRFQIYVTLYRRVIVMWLILMICLLFILLISQVFRGLAIFLFVLLWLFFIAIGILMCFVVKKRIHKGLHRCVHEVNRLLSKYDLILAIEDQGKLSCHKIAIHFIYFRLQDCVPKVAQLIRQHEATNNVVSVHSSVAVNVEGEGPDTVAMDFASPEVRAKEMTLQYTQSWVKAHMRKNIQFPSRPSEGVSELPPLHCTTSYCLCQYIQQYHFERKLNKNWIERTFFVSDLNIRELEAPTLYGGYPAMMYAHM